MLKNLINSSFVNAILEASNANLILFLGSQAAQSLMKSLAMLFLTMRMMELAHRSKNQNLSWTFLILFSTQSIYQSKQNKEMTAEPLQKLKILYSVPDFLQLRLLFEVLYQIFW